MQCMFALSMTTATTAAGTKPSFRHFWIFKRVGLTSNTLTFSSDEKSIRATMYRTAII
jgi:hypothetical protein